MTLEAMIRAATAQGSQVHVWPEEFGRGFNATVRGPHGCRHTSIGGPDPIVTLTAALTEDDRKQRDASRRSPDAEQRDIEDAISAVDEFEGLLG